MKISCLIIDDSQHDLDSISSKMYEISQKENIELSCSKSLTYVDNLKSKHFDLYVIDIDMPIISGFNLAHKIESNVPDAVIMFCTNHDELVFDTFRLNTFYFIRKDHLACDMEEALAKFKLIHIENAKVYPFRHHDIVIKIPFNQIVYFEVLQNDLYIKTMSNNYHEKKSMKHVLDEIPSGMFIQPNQNYLVNAKMVYKIEANILFMKDGLKFTISRSHLKRLKEEYLESLD
jgi:DNA-binding LytR/AlgR family response regulator